MVTTQRPLFGILRNLAIAAVLYYFLLFTVRLIHSSSPSISLMLGADPHHKNISTFPTISRPSVNKIRAFFSTRREAVQFNPSANVFNRPPSLVVPKDDYWGPRPHPDSEADLDFIVRACRGSYDGLEKMGNVFDCLKFLAEREEEYYFLPHQSSRASSQDPAAAEYANADGNGNTLTNYVSVENARPSTKDTIGECPGPIIPFHVYWTGAATWRVEAFIKSYLMSQNLECSRLWLWLDADRDPYAVEKMLKHDHLFKRFLPLVDRGDIFIYEWKFPARIALPAGLDNTEQDDPYAEDGVVRDSDGQEWLSLRPRHMTFLPQAISDAVRLVILHQHGGVYLDMDVLLLRDMRPLLLPKDHAFAERWGAHRHPGDFNTAVMSLTANSSLSSYLLQGGVRMGLNFHPRVIGRMAWKDGRVRELRMIETAAFDPIWTEFNGAREGRCTIPCIQDYSQAFMGKPGSIPLEWDSYDGQQLPEFDLETVGNTDLRYRLAHQTHSHNTAKKLEEASKGAIGKTKAEPADNHDIIKHGHELEQKTIGKIDNRYRSEDRSRPGDSKDTAKTPTTPDTNTDTATTTKSGDVVDIQQEDNSANVFHLPLDDIDYFPRPPQLEIDKLMASGMMEEYSIKQDRFPPTNRTLENFFKGAWSFHVHNQWRKHPEPSSWFDVLMEAHDGFLSGNRMNGYGEKWVGPEMRPYELWPEFV